MKSIKNLFFLYDNFECNRNKLKLFKPLNHNVYIIIYINLGIDFIAL